MGSAMQMQLDQAAGLGIDPGAEITLKGMGFCLTIANRLSLLVYMDGMSVDWFASLGEFCRRRKRSLPLFCDVLAAVFAVSSRVERGFVTPGVLWAAVGEFERDRRDAARERKTAVLQVGRRAAKRGIPADVARRMRDLFGPPGTGKGVRGTGRDRARPG